MLKLRVFFPVHLKVLIVMLRHYIKNERILAVMFLGFSSGLPLALTGSTLQAWFTQSGVNLLTIGALSLVGLPYVWKFLWAPILDRFVPPILGRRRGWILITQIVLCISLILIARLNPNGQASLIGIIAIMVAFFSASQDIAVDAYRTDVLLADERGLGSAVFTFGYRIAMLVSGGLALVFADYIGWQLTYEIMAGLIALSILTTFFSPEISKMVVPPQSFYAAVVEPFVDLIKRDKIILIILFVIFYKLGDALALSLMSNFLLRGLEFTLTDVGVAFKTGGLIATLLGAFAGGVFLIRLSLFQALLYFGLLQAASNLMFVFLAMAGKSYSLMVASIFIESFCSGMSTAAFVAFLMSLTNARFSATQYACLSALTALGRVFAGPLAAIIAERSGWVSLYWWAFVLSFPGILLLTLLRTRVRMSHVETVVEN